MNQQVTEATHQLVTVSLDRTPELPPITGEQILPGLAVVPWLDNDNSLTGLALTVHIATGKATGGIQCFDCRRRNLHLLAGVDWTQDPDQLAIDPAVRAADQADREAAGRCTSGDHYCPDGYCTPLTRVTAPRPA